MSLSNFFKKTTEPPKKSPVGSYSVEVVSIPEELDWTKYLPLEFRFLLAERPDIRPRLHAILSAGKAVGVRTDKRSSERILGAVHDICLHSQHNCILTWLPKLLTDKHLPIITAEDRARAAQKGVDLDAAVHVILDHRLKFKRMVLIDEDNIGIGDEDRRFMTELSEIVHPLAVDYIIHRIVIDNANERTEVAQNILKALLVIGPIAHTLEHWVAGFGKVFAASADDLLGETAEIMALRGSGFSWKDLRKRFVILVPVFALATYGAFQVEPLISGGHVLLGGAVFGLSAVALSLTTAIQSIGMYHESVKKLVAEGKLHENAQRNSLWWIAIVQDFTNPARLGLLLGASMAPIAGMVAALAGWMHNGWVLALVGSTESIVAGLTVIFSNRINEWRFRRKLLQKIKR